MAENVQPTDRRTLLRRGLAVVAGALGFAVIEKKSLAPDAVAAAATGETTLRFYGRHWRVQTQARRSADSAGSSHRLISRGELWDHSEGEKVGEFWSNRFCLESSFGPNPCAASNLEFQTFQLKDGTLFGMGTGGPEIGAEQGHAILGGTGRFAGARGSYVIQAHPDVDKPGTIEIVLTLST